MYLVTSISTYGRRDYLSKLFDSLGFEVKIVHIGVRMLNPYMSLSIIIKILQPIFQ
jgi:hypothetical protein